MTTSFYTYLHLRPDGTPFYVGKGRGYRAHAICHGRNKWHRNIVNKYGKEKIIVRIIKRNLTEEQAHIYEQEMISCLREFDYEICNLTNGGEGLSGWKHSTETKIKIGSRHKNKFVSEETRKKLSDKAIGRKMSAATIQKIVSKNRGHKMPETTREALKKANTGRPCSDRCRAAVSLSNSTRACSEKQRMAIVESNKRRTKK